jgi:hypothetical protein
LAPVLVLCLIALLSPAHPVQAQEGAMPLYGVPGRLVQEIGQPFVASFIFSGTGQSAGLYGRTPAVEREIGALLATGTPVQIWGTYFPEGRYTELPEIVADTVVPGQEATPTPLPTATPRPSPTATATPVITGWRASYWANPDLLGSPVLIRGEAAPSFNWGVGSPAPNIPADGFSTRLEYTTSKPTGWYRIAVNSDDGARFWVNRALMIDNWENPKPGTQMVEMYLSGRVELRLEHYDTAGNASLSLSIRDIEAETRPTPTPQAFTGWKASYFANDTLSGSPVIVRNENELNLDWGMGSPAPGIPSDGFSAIFERLLSRTPGWHTLNLYTDDGARLYIGNELVIDGWQEGAYRRLTTTRRLESSVPVRVEFFNRSGPARISFSLAGVEGPSATPLSVLPPVEGSWAASYWNNTTLAGAPVFTQYEAAGLTPLDRFWGAGSPAPGVNSDIFSARWQGIFQFENRPYSFSVEANDGVRVWIDGVPLINAWNDARNVVTVNSERLQPGPHTITIDLYEVTENAYVKLAWK